MLGRLKGFSIMDHHGTLVHCYSTSDHLAKRALLSEASLCVSFYLYAFLPGNRLKKQVGSFLRKRQRTPPPPCWRNLLSSGFLEFIERGPSTKP